MAKNKTLKRKSTPIVKKKQTESVKPDNDEESTSDHEVNIGNFQ